MKCPNCGLVNPDSAEICDCGYNFVTHVQGKPIEGSGVTNEGMTGGEWLGAIFCTPYGLVKYFDWKNTSPRKAKQVCTFYLIAIPIAILIRILIEASS